MTLEWLNGQMFCVCPVWHRSDRVCCYRLWSRCVNMNVSCLRESAAAAAVPACPSQWQMTRQGCRCVYVTMTGQTWEAAQPRTREVKDQLPMSRWDDTNTKTYWMSLQLSCVFCLFTFLLLLCHCRHLLVYFVGTLWTLPNEPCPVNHAQWTLPNDNPSTRSTPVIKPPFLNFWGNNIIIELPDRQFWIKTTLGLRPLLTSPVFHHTVCLKTSQHCWNRYKIVRPRTFSIYALTHLPSRINALTSTFAFSIRALTRSS